MYNMAPGSIIIIINFCLWQMACESFSHRKPAAIYATVYWLLLYLALSHANWMGLKAVVTKSPTAYKIRKCESHFGSCDTVAKKLLIDLHEAKTSPKTCVRENPNWHFINLKMTPELYELFGFCLASRITCTISNALNDSLAGRFSSVRRNAISFDQFDRPQTLNLTLNCLQNGRAILI